MTETRQFGVEALPAGALAGTPATATATATRSHLEPDVGVTTLDALRELVADEITPEPIEINVPHRPGASVRYSVMLEVPTFEAWQRQNRRKSAPSGYDDLGLSCTVLAAQSVAVLVGGKVVLDDSGEPATFRSPEIHAMLGVQTSNDAVRRFYANDGHLLAVAAEVVSECGYGEEVAANAPDPTRLP